MSMASMISALSVEFFPAVYENFWMGLNAISFSWPFHEFMCVVVQSPYTLRMVTFPYLEASSKTRFSNLGCALSPSTSKAILFIFSIKSFVVQSYGLRGLLPQKNHLTPNPLPERGRPCNSSIFSISANKSANKMNQQKRGSLRFFLCGTLRFSAFFAVTKLIYPPSPWSRSFDRICHHDCFESNISQIFILYIYDHQN